MKTRQNPGVLLTVGMFALFGLVFWFAAIWLGLRQHQIITQWPRTEVTVLSSRVSLTKPEMYSAEIQLRYSLNGKTQTRTVMPGETTSIHGLMQQLVDRYPAGSKQSLPYNPQNDTELVLDAGYNLSFFLLPLVLALIGLIISLIAIGSWLLERFARKPKASGKRSYPPGKRLPQLVGTVFVVLGGLFLGLVGWFAVAEAGSAHWPRVEAKVASSRVLSYHRRSQVTYYAAAVDYSYSVKGKSYLMPACPVSGLDSEQAALDALATDYPPNSIQMLVYNPANPYQLRLHKADLLWAWIVGGIGAVFLLLGSVLLLVFRKA